MQESHLIRFAAKPIPRKEPSVWVPLEAASFRVSVVQPLDKTPKQAGLQLTVPAERLPSVADTALTSGGFAIKSLPCGALGNTPTPFKGPHQCCPWAQGAGRA